MEPPSCTAEDYLLMGLSLLLTLVVYSIIKSGEIYLLTMSERERKSVSEESAGLKRSLFWLLQTPDTIFGTINQISILLLVIISLLSLLIVGLLPAVALLMAMMILLIFGYKLPDLLATRKGILMASVTGYFINSVKWIAYPVNSIICLFIKRAEETKEERDVKSVEEYVDERGVLLNIVKLSETTVNDIMTPRVSVKALEGDYSWERVKSMVVESGFSRLPVYDKTIDNVMGFLYIKDLLGYIEHSESFDWTKHIREVYFVPGVKKIGDLLEEFRQKKIHLAVVVDEYGGVDGIVTLEDILEEIVGEISDETDIEDLT